MRRQFCKLLVLSLTLMMGGISPAQHRTPETDSPAKDLLGKARAAVASEARLSPIQSLSASFEVRQQLPNGAQLTGEVQLDFLLPEKFRKTERWDLPGNAGQIISIFVLDGNNAQFDTRATSSKVPILRGSEADAEKERLALTQKLRKESAIYLLQLLLRDPANLFSDFQLVGEAEAEDGRADVVEAHGLGDSPVRLFFDRQSHHLLLMSYYQGAPQKLSLSHAGQDKTAPPDKQTAASNEAKIEVQLHFSDYRPEGGVNVPHLIVLEKNGKVTEERKLKRFSINPAFPSDHFEVKSKVR